MFLEIL